MPPSEEVVIIVDAENRPIGTAPRSEMRARRLAAVRPDPQRMRQEIRWSLVTTPIYALPAALVRVEQLYPWDDEAIDRAVRRYASAEQVVWVQEEPANMGAWTFVRERLQDALRDTQKLA